MREGNSLNTADLAILSVVHDGQHIQKCEEMHKKTTYDTLSEREIHLNTAVLAILSQDVKAWKPRPPNMALYGKCGFVRKMRGSERPLRPPLMHSIDRGVGSNFALLGRKRKGVGPERGGSGRVSLPPRTPTPFTSTAENGGSTMVIK